MVPHEIRDSSFRQPCTQGKISAPATLPLRKYPDRGWSGYTKNFALFSFSVIKTHSEVWQGINCRNRQSVKLRRKVKGRLSSKPKRK